MPIENCIIENVDSVIEREDITGYLVIFLYWDIGGASYTE